jgi:hypothetical protein
MLSVQLLGMVVRQIPQLGVMKGIWNPLPNHRARQGCKGLVDAAEGANEFSLNPAVLALDCLQQRQRSQAYI